MTKYTISPFAKTYNEKGELGHWQFCGEVKVEAGSLEEAVDIATKQVEDNFKNRGIRVRGVLVDSVIDENMKHTQLTAWDESGFPI